MTATMRIIVAVDLGNYKGVDCVNGPAADFVFSRAGTLGINSLIRRSVSRSMIRTKVPPKTARQFGMCAM